MSFIQRELDRLNEAIRNTPSDHPGYQPLHAAQQALSWASEPEGFSSPSATLHKFFGVGNEVASRGAGPVPPGAASN